MSLESKLINLSWCLVGNPQEMMIAMKVKTIFNSYNFKE